MKENMARIQTKNLDSTFKMLKGASMSLERDEGQPSNTFVQRVQAPSLSLENRTGGIGVRKSAGVRQSNIYSGSEFLEPFIRNPLISATNFYLPQTNLELNAWIRYFDRFHPIVGNAIDMHATVPFSRFELVGISDPHVQRFYEDMADQLDLFRRILEISREYELIGECFPFAYWDEEMNAFSDITILNPDYIIIRGIKMVGSEGLRYEMVIDEELRQFIMSQDPLDWEIIQKIDPVLIRAAESGLNAPLDPFNLSHLARLGNPYDVRGTSIVLGCVKDLLYEEQLREAQYAIAGGIVRPREIWKLGIKDEYMPTETDLMALRQLLRSAEYDPNFAIISHHGLDVDFIGAERRILPIHPELEDIENRVLTRLYTSRAMTHGEGPCHLPYSQGLKDDVEILSQRGFIPWYELADGEALAAFNPQTEQIEFHVPTNRIVRDYDGEVVDVYKGKLDLSMTSNHRMWIKKGSNGEWGIVPADKLREGYCLRCDMKPQDGDAPEEVTIDGYRQHRFIKEYRKKYIKIKLDDYLALAGYYVSEGSLDFEHRYAVESYPAAVSISQLPKSKNYDRIYKDLNRLPFNVSFHGKDRFRICDRLLAQHMFDEFGCGAASKKIPSWIKQLPAKKLEIIIRAMLAGDGYRMTGQSWEYYTVSEQLAKDFQEMAFRAGYATQNTYRDRGGNRKKQYRCRISSSSNPKIARQPNLKGAIKKRHYKGKVWCFEVPPHELFVVRSGGKVYITGNTYSNASVAMRVLDARYATKRDFIMDWVVNSLFTPVALANEFYKPSKRELAFGFRSAQHDRELILPDFKWLSLVNLIDRTSQMQYAMQLAQGSRYPLKGVCDLLQLDYDDAMAWLKKEQGTEADIVFQETRKQKASAEARTSGTIEGGGNPNQLPGGGKGTGTGQQSPEEKKLEQDNKKSLDETKQIGKDIQREQDKAEPSQKPPDLGKESKTFGLDTSKKKVNANSILAGAEFLGRVPKKPDKLLKGFSPRTIKG